jgi:sulfide:quinone oxidoreductase
VRPAHAPRAARSSASGRAIRAASPGLRSSSVKHVVILGAGFAGLELATRLSESLAGQVRTTLIDQNDSFTFGFSKLDVLFGRKTKEDVRLHYSEISKDGVEFRQERVIEIDPEARRVATDDGSYDADILVVALGADYDFAATPGFAEGGVEYYSVAGAEHMGKALANFDSGTILIGILGHPFKCPPAPFEAALLLHDHFLERGVRDAVEIRTIGPMAAPVPITKELSQAILDLLHERGIDYLPNQQIVELDPDRTAARLARRRQHLLRPLRRHPRPSRAGCGRALGPDRRRLGAGGEAQSRDPFPERLRRR